MACSFSTRLTAENGATRPPNSGDDAGNNLRVAVFTQRIRKRRLLVKQHPALKDAQSASAVQAASRRSTAPPLTLRPNGGAPPRPRRLSGRLGPTGSPCRPRSRVRVVSPAWPAACRDHDLGVVSADDLLDGRGPGVAPSVGDDDRRAAQLVARGERGHRRAVEHRAPDPLVELAGRPPRDRRCLRVGGVQGGGGRRIRRRGA